MVEVGGRVGIAWVNLCEVALLISLVGYAVGNELIDIIILFLMVSCDL